MEVVIANPLNIRSSSLCRLYRRTAVFLLQSKPKKELGQLAASKQNKIWHINLKNLNAGRDMVAENPTTEPYPTDSTFSGFREGKKRLG